MRQWSKTIPCCVIVCTKIVTQTKTGKEDGETDSSLQRENIRGRKGETTANFNLRTSTFLRLGVSSLIENLGTLCRNGNISFRSGEFLGRQKRLGFYSGNDNEIRCNSDFQAASFQFQFGFLANIFHLYFVYSNYNADNWHQNTSGHNQI